MAIADGKIRLCAFPHAPPLAWRRAGVCSEGLLNFQLYSDLAKTLVETARKAGARVVTGGAQSGEAGTFVSPAMMVGCAPGSAIVRAEVFGPALVALPFDSLDEVVDAANDSDYGLAASIWSQSLSDTHRLSRCLKAGTIWINCTLMYDAALLIGGMKQSAWGRDSGRQALGGYLE